jgi:class 3 adenylate cyclase
MAARVFGWEEAAEHWSAALERMEDEGVPRQRRVSLLERIGDLIYVTGENWQRGVAQLEEALAIHEELGNTARAAQIHSRLARDLCTYPERADIPRARSHCQAALRLVGEHDENAGVAALHVVVATVEFQALNPQPGLRATELALEISERIGSTAIWANAAALRSSHLTMAGRFRESREMLERARELNQTLNQAPLAFFLASFGSYLGFLRCDWKDATAWTASELEGTRMAQAPAQRSFLRRFHAMGLGRMGRLDEARKLLETLDYDDARLVLFAWAGDWERCERLALQQVELYRASGVSTSEQLSLAELGRARYGRGDLDGAIAAWEEQERISRERGAVVPQLLASTSLVDALAQQRRIDEAQRYLATCRTLLDNGEDWGGTRGLVDAAAGTVAAVQGRMDEAAPCFERALALARRFEDRWQEAEVHYRWGRALSDAGKRRAASEKLDAALAIYRGMDAGTPWLERVLAEKLRVQGSSTAHEPTRSIDIVAACIDEDRPDLRPHAAPDGTVTLLFSDMEGFTEMTQRIGDLEAREVIRRHNAIVRRACAAHGGYEVELQGDGFLLAFGSARSGLHCATTIQRALADDAARHPEEPIRVRIGLHTGEVLRDADKFFGATVILAARIAAQAGGGEILASSLLKQLTESLGDLRFDAPRQVQLKGFAGSYEVFPVEWH